MVESIAADGPGGDAPVAPWPDISDIKVAVLSDAMSGRNGVDTYYRDVQAHLRDRMGHMDLINPETWGSMGSFVSLRLPGDSTQRIYFPRMFKLHAALKTMNLDGIVVPAPGPFGLFGLVLARRYRVPLIAGMHTNLELLSALYWNRVTARLARWYLEGMARILHRQATYVVVNSPVMQDKARQLGARDCRVLATPLGPEFLEGRRTRPPGPIRTILFAGRLAPEKNIVALLQAVADFPQLRLMIAGDGPQRALVEEAAARLPNIDFQGRVTRRQLAGLYDEADLLVLPSRIEAFGTVVLEALARECPALIYEDCGIAGWPDLAAGLLVMRRDETLADGLRRLVELPAATLQAMAARGRQQALQHHERALRDWAAMFASLRKTDAER